MDLDWCLICERKTDGALYCSEECRFKDYLSAYTYLTPPASPTTSGSSTPTDSGSSTSSASIATNNSFAYPFYRKPSPCFQRPPITNTNTDLKNNMAICVILPEMKKSQSALNPAFKTTIEMSKDSNVNLGCSLDTRHLHI
ncbi:hypothetical protein C1645_762884 [Glomus cerebriforme]|uniref:Uncharacterized protein n=1 Tax=Glomus cerebriforme TaxID=658196 RepID=A0A397T8J1_9GLOM|nr:hypothetical protein C1645_762884 [Glomus cerebriforme]